MAKKAAHSSAARPPVSQFEWHNVLYVCVSFQKASCVPAFDKALIAIQSTGVQAKMALICIRDTWNLPTASLPGKKSNSMFVWPLHIWRGETFGTELSTGRNAANRSPSPRQHGTWEPPFSRQFAKSDS